MKDICTKTGDGGMTSLRGGLRVGKDDLRIEVNGQIDHLNSILGIVRAYTHDELVEKIQRELMVIMSHIATPVGTENPKALHADELITEMEQAIRQLTAEKVTGFVIPGRDIHSAFIHVARTQTRNVERRLWTLNRQYSVNPSVLIMMNRLSDYLFALAL